MVVVERGRQQMLESFLARERGQDRRFVAGVRTTGIYCVASCPARKPRPENVEIFATAAAATAAGYRPCRRCRPDLVAAGRDPERETVEEVWDAMRTAPGDFPDLGAVVARSGYGKTRLGELFRIHRHETVVGALVRARVAWAAAELLRAPRRRVLDVALDAGFESSSTFHDAFRRELGTTPVSWRRAADAQVTAFTLPGDFRLADAMAFCARDPESPAERWDGRVLQKAFVHHDGRPVVLELAFARGAVTVRAHGAVRGRVGRWSPEEIGAFHGLARHLLGLPTDAAAFARRARRVPGGAAMVRGGEGLRLARTASLGEALVWAVVGQQVTVAFAARCRRALVARLGRPAPGGMLAHPDGAALAGADAAVFRAAQLSRGKGATLHAVAAALTAGDLDDLGAGSAVAAEQRLLAIRGVGPWTAQYALMRGLGFADCAPVGDAGLAAGVQGLLGLEGRACREQIGDFLSPFAPSRTLACAHVWHWLGANPQPVRRGRRVAAAARVDEDAKGDR